MLKPMDIHTKEFKKSVRGYDQEEVDAFLDEIIVDFEKMQREIDLLRNQLTDYSESIGTLKERESSLNNAILSAQRFADLLKKDAEETIQAKLAEAEEQAGAILAEAQERLASAEKDYESLLQINHEVKGTIRQYLQAQLQALDGSYDTIEVVPLTLATNEDYGLPSSSKGENKAKVEQVAEEAPEIAVFDIEETKLNMTLAEEVKKQMK